MPSPTNESGPQISNAEWEVMKVFWDREAPMAARDAYDALPDGHGWAVKTVKTLLSRLVAKGALAYEQVGNSYLYRAAVTREQATRREARGFVDRVLDGSLMPMLAHFIEDDAITDEEAARLERLLKERRKHRGGKTE
jgi:BlaI family penicillinase repressor